MGAFDQQLPESSSQEGIIEITSESNPGVKVWVRTKVTREDERTVTNLFVNRLLRKQTAQHRRSNPFQGQQVSAEEQLQLAERIWIEHLLVRWNLPIDLTDKQKAVSRLTGADCSFIYQKIMEAHRAQCPEEQLPRPGLGSSKRERARVFEAAEKRYQSL